MKTKGSMILLLLIFWGCNESILDVETPVFVTITTTTNSGGVIDPAGSIRVKSGESVVYTIKPDNDYGVKFIKVNGDKYNLSENNTLNLGSVFSDKNVVVDFVPNIFFHLTKKEPLYLAKSLIIQDGLIVDESILSEERRTDKYYFYEDGKMTAVHSNGVLFASNDWSVVNKNQITIANRTYVITSSEKEIILDDDSKNWGGTWNGKPCIYRDIYERH